MVLKIKNSGRIPRNTRVPYEKLEWGCPYGTKYPPRQPIQTPQVKCPKPFYLTAWFYLTARVYRQTDGQTDGQGDSSIPPLTSLGGGGGGRISYAWLPRKCDYWTDRQTPDKVIPMCSYASQATQLGKALGSRNNCRLASMVKYFVKKLQSIHKIVQKIALHNVEYWYLLCNFPRYYPFKIQ